MYVWRKLTYPHMSLTWAGFIFTECMYTLLFYSRHPIRRLPESTTHTQKVFQLNLSFWKKSWSVVWRRFKCSQCPSSRRWLTWLLSTFGRRIVFVKRSYLKLGSAERTVGTCVFPPHCVARVFPIRRGAFCGVASKRHAAMLNTPSFGIRRPPSITLCRQASHCIIKNHSVSPNITL
jgi:hypothetical protein